MRVVARSVMVKRKNRPRLRSRVYVVNAPVGFLRGPSRLQKLVTMTPIRLRHLAG
jgi:hypothetical protein